MTTKSKNSQQHIDLMSFGNDIINTGASQSHGVIISCNPQSFEITQCSQNYLEVFNGFSQDLLGNNLSVLIDVSKIDLIKDRLQREIAIPPQEISVAGRKYMMHSHISGANLILDIEPLHEVSDPYLFQRQLSHILSQLQGADKEIELCNIAASLMQELFGYDRTLVCRFDEDNNGEVIAEARHEEMQSMFGLQLPATDLPDDVRRAFLVHKVRMVANVSYTPVPIVPSLSPITNKPLDLSKSQLKTVSPFLIEYHKSMKLGASLTASIVINNKLWGIIICHHRSAKFINHYQRENCRFLVEMLAHEISLRDSQLFEKRINKIIDLRKKLTYQLRSELSLVKALSEGNIKFTDLLESSGGAMFFKDEIILDGITPTKEEVKTLFTEFVIKQKQRVFATKQLASIFPKAKAYTSKVAGILALRITNKKFIVWFRQEALQTINLTEDLDVQKKHSSEINLASSPKDTIVWSHRVSGRSKVWEKSDFDIAGALREDIRSALVEHQYREISSLYDQISEVNKELELFSFGLSHDLKAPLRGIEGYLNFFKEDFEDKVGEEGRAQIDTIIELTHRMRDLIDDILAFSSLKVHKLSREKIAVNSLIDEILSIINVEVSFPETRIIYNQNFHEMIGDKRLLFQLWSNLIGNALKYSSRVENPVVEIGQEQCDDKTVYFVRDNGIGVKDEFHSKIFETFARVSGSNYKGTGVGLAICKRIVEKHGGQIWVESKPGKGATFYFNV